MNGKVYILIHLNLTFPASHFMSAAEFTQKTLLVPVEKFTKLNHNPKLAWAKMLELGEMKLFYQ